MLTVYSSSVLVVLNQESNLRKMQIMKQLKNKHLISQPKVCIILLALIHVYCKSVLEV